MAVPFSLILSSENAANVKDLGSVLLCSVGWQIYLSIIGKLGYEPIWSHLYWVKFFLGGKKEENFLGTWGWLSSNSNCFASVGLLSCCFCPIAAYTCQAGPDSSAVQEPQQYNEIWDSQSTETKIFTSTTTEWVQPLYHVWPLLSQPKKDAFGSRDRSHETVLGALPKGEWPSATQGLKYCGEWQPAVSVSQTKNN